MNIDKFDALKCAISDVLLGERVSGYVNTYDTDRNSCFLGNTPSRMTLPYMETLTHLLMAFDEMCLVLEDNTMKMHFWIENLDETTTKFNYKIETFELVQKLERVSEKLNSCHIVG